MPKDTTNRKFVSVPMDAATKVMMERAAKHGGLSLAAFLRGTALFFIEINELTNLVGRPPTHVEAMKYNPHRLPQSIAEVISREQAG